MKMRGVLFALLLVLAPAIACNASIKNVVVGQTQNCANGVAPHEAIVYAGETFYVCGEVQLNGKPLLAGTITGNEKNVMKDQAAIVNGKFSLYGVADVNKHMYYYIIPSLEKPCKKEFAPVPLEIRTECVFVPPSTIEAVPDAIMQGERFTLEVKNSPTELRMEVTGLKTPITEVIPKGGSWSRTLLSNECSEIGSCVINFKFTDSKHPLCTASTSIAVTVKAADENQTKKQENTPLLIATFMILVLGTAGALILNR